MTTYTAQFRTDADYAERTFKARTAKQAFALARTFYDEHDGELLFQNYDGGSPVNEIEISGPTGSELAIWQDDDLRLRLAATDMLAALELCEDALVELARLDDGTPSVSALHAARAAIAKAKPPAA
jgi:hypothetical protein